MQQDDNAIMRRVNAMKNRVDGLRAGGLYFYNQPVSELRGGATVLVNGKTHYFTDSEKEVENFHAWAENKQRRKETRIKQSN